MTDTGEKAVQSRISGRVQGVGFRAWVQEQARRRMLRGWVRNETDGTVTALIAGPQATVDEMVDALRTGPPAASVARVTTRRADMPIRSAGFRIAG